LRLSINKVRNDNSGVSLIELIVTLTILSILASLVLPSVQMTSKRTKELELRRDLRTIRAAIDEFKKNADKPVGAGLPPPSGLGKSGCPTTLGQLVEGTDFGDVNGVKKKFLRRIPVDPFHPVMKDGAPEWGLRSYTDSPDSTNWGGEDVYDVYSKSEDTAIDGTKYKDW
jgi:general secretion pathway protein G